MPEKSRRDVLRSSGATILGLFDWFDIFGDGSSDSSGYNPGPERKIKSYPLTHGTDVDTPADAHHIPPGAGEYLSLASNDMSVNVTQETFSFNLAAASSGQVPFDFSGAYKIASWGIRFPNISGGGLLSDISARPTEWALDSNNNKGGITIAWNNGSTGDEKGLIEVLGLEP